MKNKKIIKFLFVTIFFVVIFASAVFAIQEEIVLSGGSVGSTTNLMVSAMSDIARNFCDFTSPTVVINPTSAQVNVLKNREADIATVNGYLTYDAYNGLGQWEGEPFKELRSLTDRPNSQIQIIVLKDSPINKISDLSGKRVVFFKKGSTAAVVGMQVFTALGFADDVNVVYLGAQDAKAKMLTKQVDACIMTGTYPNSFMTELSLSYDKGIRFISLTEEEVEICIEEHPYLVAKTVEPLYKGEEEETLTVVLENIYGCTTDMSEEKAYCLTKNFWEHLGDVVALHWESLGRLKLKDTSTIKRVAPWHIGAYKYYKEAGLEIPPEMVPPEAN